MRLEPGDLVLSRVTSVLSYPIQWVTGCEWTHVDVYVGGGLVAGAVWPKVRVLELRKIPLYTVYRINALPSEKRASISNFVMERVGDPYDLMQFFLLGYRILTDTMGKYSDDPNPDAYVCSELIAEAALRHGIRFGRFVDNVLPGHIIVSPLTSKIL